MQISHNIALESFHSALLCWYHSYGRKNLPWRNFARDGSYAYPIYISEIMLQQTQLSRVLESYYFPFLARFPTLSTLAKSSEQEVLHLWQGLGYYSRARNLHACAKICVKQHNAKLPDDLRALQALPGIGAYTAGAIMCFGFGRVAHFADSNITRVLQRLVATKSLSQKWILALAKSLLPQSHQVFDYHQALIDLGALVCTTTPKCASCPITNHCTSAFKPIPPKSKASKLPLTLHLAICKNLDSIALCQSQEHLYKGLYNLPIIAKDTQSQSPLPTHRLLGSFTHAYTKYAITTYVYEVPSACLPTTLLPNMQWCPIHNLPPISNLTKKALRYF
ncbi:A/G-specific adenine glycosylase [Helicobacter sp.]|uniref:A/G-specific adenine glycosylase n=1 Tax=Helicobacter sp. TaxID=218 RepID=UPI0025C5B24C|nr:A/G-specific adenine glycosylase [Helicobacter sp.]MBR2495498.1 A/G-specific adenine glycosylase [Helicobacter sp.]